KKDVTSTEEATDNLLKKEPVLPAEVINKPSKKEINLTVAELNLMNESDDENTKANFKEDFLKNVTITDTEPQPLATSQITTPTLRQNIQIDGPAPENIQNVVQSNVLTNH